ncbi:peptidase S8/S53 domain-containing protein [Hygrophoropsis aurantiaca]|uniref:Peptidase S8/S53 domain-containing protein n=1 Tax=Hygrophoropsis aurantiaca TaxID=72124 RepID=A0ACB8ABB6_9AGAM|nr:peptidase S8/S53 domain-containing protein [Hygrophoropsis aurantiaca]
MRLPLSLILVLLAHQCVIGSPPTKRSYSTHDYYVLEHKPSAGASLADCALALGVEVVEQAGELINTWLVRIPTPGLSARSVSDGVLEKYEQLRLRAGSHDHADILSRSDERIQARRITSSIKHLSRQTPRQRTKRAPPPITPSESPSSSAAIAARLGFVDPLFTKQWHIVNDEEPSHMMNVTGVWEMGFTGAGVTTSLVDDGLDYNSKDLAPNFDAADSYDFNDHVALPTPKLSDDHHGTRCAGQIAAAKNDVCGVGLAYNSKVAGVRILSGPITDVDEAAALNYGFQNVSIYSCSWGPPDDGKSMEGPGYLIQKAVLNGIENGRAGKGSIFVFASGNGAAAGDQCNFDGYTNSIYSVTVSAVDHKGLHPYYSEPCAANMVVAYSSGSGKQIVTTDVGENACSSGHGGTSAAAPNAAGVFALALQARPDLTWRDIQHLCVLTALKINPNDPDWEKTASGQSYSYKYGFGALDAYAYVSAAQDWTLVKPQAWFEPPAIQIANGSMTEVDKKLEMHGGEQIVKGGVSSTFRVTSEMLEEHNFESGGTGLEHVTVRVWISHTKRGDVEVELRSPAGITSVLAAKRDRDAAKTGYPGWRFMSVKHWGENPIGDWTIRVSDIGTEGHTGTFHGWRLMFWGSAADASLAKNYLLPTHDTALPSVLEEDSTPLPAPSTTKSHPKPTAGLPADHGDASGEASRPAFPPSSSPSVTPTPDEGWFPNLSSLISNQKWFFAAVGLVSLFAICAGVFFFRRRRQQRQRQRLAYAALAGEDVGMVGMGSVRGGGERGGTKELYDAFGEVSDDDDDDADEETGLTRGRGVASGLGFHSGFLDDADADEGRETPSHTHYHDVPEGESPEIRSISPASGSGSGSGSWEHASQVR